MRLEQIGVRRATPKDAQDVADVHDASWRNTYRGIIPGAHLERMVARRGSTWWLKAIRRHAAVLVMEVGGEIAGYATVGPSRMKTLPYAGEIYELYLAPEYQGLGFGKALFAAARKELASYGLKSFAVRALADNDMATRFYDHHGGKLVTTSAEKIGDAALPVVVFGFAD